MWLSHTALCSPQLLLYLSPFMAVIILFTIIAFQSVIIYLTCLILIRLVSREIIAEKQQKMEKMLYNPALRDPILIQQVNDDEFIRSMLVKHRLI